MKLNNLFESILLEKVYGTYAVVYHRTRVQDLADKIYTSGFKPGAGAMYGKGFYSTYDLESQMKPEMSEIYGNVVIKFAVPTTNFIFFDYEPFTKSPIASKIKDYDESNFIFKQLDYFGMEYNKEHIQRKLKSQFSSEVAINCFKYIPNFTKKCDGIVFTGSRDGKVLVCYNLKSIIPLSYRQDGQTQFTKITNKSIEYLKSAWKEKNRPEGERPYTPEDFGITNYKVNPDGTIDVEGDVDLSQKKLKKLPFNFGKVTGDFDCSNNNLASLEGAPKTVGGLFLCSNNNLISLKGAPRSVVGGFYCDNNNLTSLEGAPKTVVGGFYCDNNNLTSLEGAPKTVGRSFYCHNNNLTSLEGAPKTVGKQFKCYYNAASFTEEEVRAVTKVEGKVVV